uniref:Uncharacterized protein n=1 Tax=Arundo donax TaxID=35708 RepID=A0A0A9F6K0_ARUDO
MMRCLRFAVTSIKLCRMTSQQRLLMWTLSCQKPIILMMTWAYLMMISQRGLLSQNDLYTSRSSIWFEFPHFRVHTNRTPKCWLGGQSCGSNGSFCVRRTSLLFLVVVMSFTFLG